MKNLELHALVIITLVMVTLTSMVASPKYSQGFFATDQYAMLEPFASGPLITYPSLEASRNN